MKKLTGCHLVAGILWILLWWVKFSSVVGTAGAKCKDVYIPSSHLEASTVLPLLSINFTLSPNYIYSLPFQGKMCLSYYRETWDTAYRVCQYNSSHLLSLNVFNLNYSDIKPIIGNTKALHIGMQRQNGIFHWIGLKPEMFHTSINQSAWGWQWRTDEPQEKNCVAVNVTSGKLFTVSCNNNSLKFICVRKDGLDMTSKLCKPGWKYSPFAKLCIQDAIGQISTIILANNFCEEKSSRLLSNETFFASYSALRFESLTSQEYSRVWLNTAADKNKNCYCGLRNSHRTVINNCNCSSSLEFICEQDPLAVDIKVKLEQSTTANSYIPVTLICRVYINGSTSFTIDHYIWWKNGEIFSDLKYFIDLQYNSRIENLSMEQGRYWCEVIITGYPDRVSSAPYELYHTDISTLLMVIGGSNIPYDPIRYDRSKPDFEEKFLPLVKKKLSVIEKKFTERFPLLPRPEWQVLNESKNGSFTTLKINIFLNHEKRKRPADEEKQIFNPVRIFLSSQCRSRISDWVLQACDITNVGMCFTQKNRTMIGDIIWNQTYHSKHVTSLPMCLNDDWKILTRRCDGGYGIGSEWSPFNQNQCVRFNKVVENINHHHCQPGYISWNYTTCIRIYSTPSNWSEAAAECSRSLGFLFTPKLASGNISLHNFNSTFKIFEKLGEIWLGGHRENGIMQWIAFEPGSIELDNSAVVEWKEENDLRANCVSGVIGNGKVLIQNKPCEERKPYVCMHKNPKGQLFPISECRENWYGSPWLNFCYMVNSKSYTWEKALDYCRDYKPDGTLAVLISPEENDLLKNHLLKHFRMNTWWIGLKKVKNYFIWSNNNKSKLEYVDWYLDSEQNLPDSVVAYKMKYYENSVRWLQLNSAEEQSSICQTRTMTGITWCQTTIIRDKAKTAVYKCKLGHAIYDSVTWYKDGLAVSGNRGLLQNDIEEFNPNDLLNNSVLPFKEFYHLQGYYWCEVQQKEPFMSVSSPKVLFVKEDYWTFIGHFVATELKGHYNRGQKKFWNMAEKITSSLNRIIFNDNSLVTDVYIADLSTMKKGNEVKFYTYYQPLRNKRDNLSKKKQHLENIKQHMLQQLKKSGNTLVENYGIIPESLSIMSTDVCFFEETLVDGKLLIWEVTPAGKSVSPTENCIKENGQPVFRRCLGNFTHGVYWGSIDGSCSGKGSKVTLSLKTLSEKQIEYSNVRNTTKTLEMLTRNADKLIGMDLHYVATTLENIANQKDHSKMAVEDVIATINNVMVVQQKIIDDVQRSVNASLRMVASLETILKDSKKMYNITKPNIAIFGQPLNSTNSSKIIGIASLDRHADRFELSDVVTIRSNFPVSYSKTSAGIWLPMELLKERIGQNSSINFILYRNATLFVSPSDVQKTTAVVSPVISAFFSGEPVHLFSQTIKMAFKIWQMEKEIPGSARCVYWEQNMNEKQGGWSSRGCTKPNIQSGHILCSCDHLTSFAVLVDLYDNDEDDNVETEAHGVALDIITYIGCTLSIFGLLLTIITFATFRKLRNGLGSQVLCHLSVSLLLSLIVFMAGINQTHWKPGCIFVAALLHYLLMVAFSWMLVEAVLQYLRLVKVIGTYIPRFILKSAICSWGIPLLVVISILAVDYELYHSKKNYCWIHIKAFYYGFLLPVALVMICNIVIFALIIHSITCGRQKGLRTNQSERKLAITRLRAACCILFLLGLSWSFGFLAVSDARLVFKYLFSIFTTLQGFFIFFFHVIQEKTTRNLWYNYIFHKKDSQIQTLTTRDTSTIVKDSTVSRNK